MLQPKIINVLYMDPAQDQAALDFALSIARRYSATLKALYIAPEFESIPYPAYVYGAPPIVPEVDILHLREENEKRKKKAEKAFKDTIINSSIKLGSFEAITGLVEDILAEKGRVSDLLVIPHRKEYLEYNHAADSALFGGNCPVLLVPPECEVKFNNKIIIAWNGSREASNALAWSLPYLEGSDVYLWHKDENSQKMVVGIDHVETYLHAHEIDVNVIYSNDGDEEIIPSLMKVAKSVKASLVVMGAWGHNRAHEFITGGVTRSLLKTAPDLPIFLAH